MSNQVKKIIIGTTTVIISTMTVNTAFASYPLCPKPTPPVSIQDLKNYVNCLNEHYHSEKGGWWSDIRVKQNINIL
ncbi:hypothetical protein [Cysteiniphilum litorale]|uniref:hypothetical protein n=1 Tax=Cysteiniphilum litorale TaxID=2056700 RepID=UPI003F880597